jgi:acyl carrier protein
MAVEEGFDIEISNEEAEKIRTPRMYYDIVQHKLKGPLPDMSPEDIRLKTRHIFCEQLGVKDNFGDDADFVEDLGAD